jgi:hypothetical protein
MGMRMSEKKLKFISFGNQWQDVYTIGFSMANQASDGSWCFMIHLTKWVLIIGWHYRTQ